MAYTSDMAKRSVSLLLQISAYAYNRTFASQSSVNTDLKT